MTSPRPTDRDRYSCGHRQEDLRSEFGAQPTPAPQPKSERLRPEQLAEIEARVKNTLIAGPAWLRVPELLAEVKAWREGKSDSQGRIDLSDAENLKPEWQWGKKPPSEREQGAADERAAIIKMLDDIQVPNKESPLMNEFDRGYEDGWMAADAVIRKAIQSRGEPESGE